MIGRAGYRGADTRAGDSAGVSQHKVQFDPRTVTPLSLSQLRSHGGAADTAGRDHNKQRAAAAGELTCLSRTDGCSGKT